MTDTSKAAARNGWRTIETLPIDATDFDVITEAGRRVVCEKVHHGKPAYTHSYPVVTTLVLNATHWRPTEAAIADLEALLTAATERAEKADEIAEDLRAEMKKIALAVGRSTTDGETDCDWAFLGEQVAEVVERAETAEARSFDANVTTRHLRSRVAALEGGLCKLLKHRDDYLAEFMPVDPNTGMHDGPAACEEYVSYLDDIIEMFPPLSAPPAPTVSLAAHTAQDRYEHFLSYTGIKDTPEVRLAYHHGANSDGADELLNRAGYKTDKQVSQAAADVLAERRRQIEEEGWTPEHDDREHSGGGLIKAACCYAMLAQAQGRVVVAPDAYKACEPNRFIGWPWADRWWKPTTPRRDLVKSAALILAEIERLDRAAQHDEPERCIACDKPFQDGDRYFPDADGGCIHADCGGERESYTNDEGEPLGPNDPIPEPSVWTDEREG